MTTEAKPEELLLALPSHLPLRAGLVFVFEATLAHATTVADRKRPTKTSLRIYRKTLRRARALLVLCRSAMAEEEYASLRTALRTAHQATSTGRDQDMLIQLLANDDVGQKAGVVAQAFREELKAQRRERSLVERRELLQNSITSIANAPKIFERALTKNVQWEHIASALARTYRAARRAMRRSHDSADSQHTHDWRKRTKELGHQLELLAGDKEGPVQAAQETYARLAKQLGRIADQLALRERLSESSLCKADVRILDRVVKRRIDALIVEPQEGGEHAFHARPKRLAQELIAEVQASRGEAA